MFHSQPRTITLIHCNAIDVDFASVGALARLARSFEESLELKG